MEDDADVLPDQDFAKVAAGLFDIIEGGKSGVHPS